MKTRSAFPIIASDLTPEQVQAYRIADNKTGEIAEWNYDLLPVEIKELQEKDFDLSLLGFDADELDKFLNGGTEENTIAEGETDADAVPEVPEKSVSKHGEIYQLGKHRLMCGDSTKAEDVARLMSGGKARDPVCLHLFRREVRSNNARDFRQSQFFCPA